MRRMILATALGVLGVAVPAQADKPTGTPPGHQPGHGHACTTPHNADISTSMRSSNHATSSSLNLLSLSSMSPRIRTMFSTSALWLHP